MGEKLIKECVTLLAGAVAGLIEAVGMVSVNYNNIANSSVPPFRAEDFNKIVLNRGLSQKSLEEWRDDV